MSEVKEYNMCSCIVVESCQPIVGSLEELSLTTACVWIENSAGQERVGYSLRDIWTAYGGAYVRMF